jgi:hypothetical protein
LGMNVFAIEIIAGRAIFMPTIRRFGLEKSV